MALLNARQPVHDLASLGVNALQIVLSEQDRRSQLVQAGVSNMFRAIQTQSGAQQQLQNNLNQGIDRVQAARDRVKQEELRKAEAKRISEKHALDMELTRARISEIRSNITANSASESEAAPGTAPLDFGGALGELQGFQANPREFLFGPAVPLDPQPQPQPNSGEVRSTDTVDFTSKETLHKVLAPKGPAEPQSDPVSATTGIPLSQQIELQNQGHGIVDSRPSVGQGPFGVFPFPNTEQERTHNALVLDKLHSFKLRLPEPPATLTERERMGATNARNLAQYHRIIDNAISSANRLNLPGRSSENREIFEIDGLTMPSPEAFDRMSNVASKPIETSTEFNRATAQLAMAEQMLQGMLDVDELPSTTIFTQGGRPVNSGQFRSSFKRASDRLESTIDRLESRIDDFQKPATDPRPMLAHTKSALARYVDARIKGDNQVLNIDPATGREKVSIEALKAGIHADLIQLGYDPDKIISEAFAVAGRPDLAPVIIETGKPVNPQGVPEEIQKRFKDIGAQSQSVPPTKHRATVESRF